MDASALYKAGQLGPAIEALGIDLRKQPNDARRRTFLFELLCFAGEYDRAAKHLEVLAGESLDAEQGAMLLRAALHAQRTREEMFLKGELPLNAVPASPSGTCNDERFETFTDEDARIGANLEVFIAGSYTWIPFRYIESVEMQAPSTLRDLLWAPAILRTTKDFRLQDLGQVLLPVLAPLSWQHPDDTVKLGRTTIWQENADGDEVPVGQKLFLADDRDVAVLEIRDLAFDVTAAGAEEVNAASDNTQEA